jgi:hypothetical protein
VEVVLELLIVLAQIVATFGVLFLGAVAIAQVARGVSFVAYRIVALLARTARRESFDPGDLAVRFPYKLTLLVRLDEETGRFRPSVQVRSLGEPTEAWIRLELVDEHGAVRLVRKRRLPAAALGTELALPPFEPPDGATADEVLGWRWDLVLEDEGGELERWREHPRPAGQLNTEAELA